MIFISRELYDGIQLDSGWERRAEREWRKRSEIYDRHYKLIAPLLPTGVRRISRFGIHDAIVESVTQNKGEICFLLDTSKALGAFRGRRLRLKFLGAHRRIPTRGLRGQWWLYHEAHLSHNARFLFQIMFHKTDVDIEANDLRIDTKV
jgi:hypothetical protein